MAVALVTGGCGFIGTWVLKQLLEQSILPVVVDPQSMPPRWHRILKDDALRVIHADIKEALRGRRAVNVLRLAVAGALSGANAIVVYATGAIVGAQLAPDPVFITMPISLFVVGMAAGRWLLRLWWRRAGSTEQDSPGRPGWSPPH